jgi:hypothetical protein
VIVAGGRGAGRDQDDRVAEPADQAATRLDAYTRGHMLHGASSFAISQRTRVP